jgi:hypothetical protein
MPTRIWKCGWWGRAKAERRCEIEHDAGEVWKAKDHNSGVCVQARPAFLPGGEGVGKLGIMLA